ncbi:MAG: hypothetical protein ACREON_05720 [Gemmatimonadaceae bacterium]
MFKVFEYSHLGGSEILQLRYPAVSAVIDEVIESITDVRKLKESRERSKHGMALYSPKDLFFEMKAEMGVEIVPTHRMHREMSSGVSYGEQLIWDIQRLRRHFPAVPVKVILIDVVPKPDEKVVAREGMVESLEEQIDTARTGALQGSDHVKRLRGRTSSRQRPETE